MALSRAHALLPSLGKCAWKSGYLGPARTKGSGAFDAHSPFSPPPPCSRGGPHNDLLSILLPKACSCKCTFLKPTYLEQRRLFLWLWVCKQALPKIRHRGSEGWPTPRRGDERHPPRKAWIVLTLHQKRRFQSPCPNPALSANTGLVTRRTTRPLERDRKQRSCPKSNGTSGQPVKDHRRRYTLRQEPSGGAGRGGAPPSLPISTKNETQSLLIFLPKKQQCLIC